MTKILSWEQIEKQYPQQWVLLEDCEWDINESQPRSGRVQLSSKSQIEFEKITYELPELPRKGAMLFVGSPDQPAPDLITWPEK